VPTLVVSALSTFDNKGLKKGKKEVSAFDKQIKSFAKTFAAAFSVTALTKFGRAAVKAFTEDEKAAKSLEQQLKNTGYQFSSPAIELYIANLQKTTGVLDDQLRPAFQQLLTITGSITTSQDALNTALNVSAATGKSLTAVSTALSRAYAGNTTGLSRLGAGLDKTLLATGDMDKIMGELNKKFAGQSAARLTTYAGKMDLLAAASANAQEIIGKGILDSLTLLSNDNTIEDLTTGMENFATATSEVILGLGQIASKLKELTNVPGVGNIFDIRNIPVIGAYIGGLRQIGRGAMPQQDRGGQERTAGRINAQQRKLEERAIKNSVALRKAENDQLKKKTAVDQLKDKFDLERIGLNVALNESVDAETKLRIKAQLAILDNNEALAKKILAEMEGAEAAKKFAASFDAALSSVMALTARINAFILKEGGTLPSGGTAGKPITYDTALSVARATNTRIENFLDQFDSSSTTATVMENASVIGPNFNAGRFRMGEERSMQGINITVDTAQAGDKFSQLIAESLQIATKSGVSYGIAGGL
jgi:hypothetical protein